MLDGTRGRYFCVVELLVIKEMNTLEIIVNAVVALIGTSGLITSLLFYSQTNRQKMLKLMVW